MSKKVIRLKEIIDEIKKDRGLMLENREIKTYNNKEEKTV